MKSKTLFVLLGLVALGLPVLTSPGWAGAPSDEKITLRLLTYFTSADPVTPMYAAVYKQFQQDFPNVTIEHEGLESANARTKLTIEMTSGNPPDISFMVTSLGQQFAKDKLLLDFRPYLTADKKWMSSYYPAALDAFTFGGKTFLVPVSIHIGGLYYNKEVLKKAGLQAPAATWGELMQQVKKIKATGSYPFVTGGKDFRFAWFITQLILRTGGAERLKAMADGKEVTGWDKPENGFIDALKLFKELIDAGAFPAGLNGMARDVSRMLFVQNQAAMYYEGTWKIGVWEQLGGPAFLNNVGWTTFPTVEGAKGDQDGIVAGPVLGWGVSGLLTGKKRDMAIELVKRLTSQQISTRMLLEIKQPTGTIPAESALTQIHPMLAAQLKLYHQAKHVALPVDVNMAPPVDNAIKKVAVPAIVDGSMTPAQAAAEVNKYAKEFFATGKK